MDPVFTHIHDVVNLLDDLVGGLEPVGRLGLHAGQDQRVDVEVAGHRLVLLRERTVVRRRRLPAQRQASEVRRVGWRYSWVRSW